MWLENISLLQFKNYKTLDLTFSSPITAIVGPNGSGKTNLLDAIYYLSLTKSAFNHIDTQNIEHHHDFFLIKGKLTIQQKNYLVQCAMQQGQKKQVKVNKQAYEKLSEHIGRFPVVLIAPDDTALIKEGSEPRRKFFDSIIAQFDADYLLALMQYNHQLKQRNSLLKQLNEGKGDHNLLEVYDRQLLRLSAKIASEREAFIIAYVPVFEYFYRYISDGNEAVAIKYSSDTLKDTFEAEFKANRQKDIYLQRTQQGIHRDDYRFKIGGYPIKKFGSQGQQKSFLIALKLAHFEVVKEKKGFKPLLLLDDIFDKLDEQRIQKMMDLVASDRFGQIFLTDARPERTERILAPLKNKLELIDITQHERKPL